MYQALYRQYRPMTFDDVMGQDHIIDTLKNQIKNNNIGHAYLFSGTRGTGKTSTAKIFSRAVSCLSPVDSNPCNECEICEGILDESIMDVVEMDAASNRGVNDIRELRDKVVYPPSYARYKVYIIDEVHMLTQEAFNALLKTLEEPPEHLIFILATTEPERIPQTILSRCQRFDFKRITIDIIIENMKKICESLDVEVEEEALRVIARNSDGGMRDALSLLDQCISFTQGNIKYEDAISILGIVNTDIVFNMVDNIIKKDIEEILLSIDNMMEDGRDVNQFIKDIILHFRDLMIVKTSKSPETLVQVDEEILNQYKIQSEKFELEYIIKILNILTEIDEKLKLSTHPRTLLEMGMIQIVNEENISIEERLSRLEQGGVVLSRKENKKENKKDINNKNLLEKSKPIYNENKVVEDRHINKDSNQSFNNEVDGNLSLKNVQNNWKNIIDSIRSEKPNVAGVLREGNVVKVENNMIFIEFEEDYSFHMNASKNNEEYIKKFISKLFNTNVEVKFDIEGLSFEREDKKKDDFTEKEKLKKVIDFFGEDRIKIE